MMTGPERDRPFVDQPQQHGELQSIFHSGCLSPCSENRTAILLADATGARPGRVPSDDAVSSF
jgi:hypothetical protein